MKKIILSSLFMTAALVGCQKEVADVDVRGSWEVMFVNNFDLTAPASALQLLCDKDKEVSFDLIGSVIRRFVGNVSVPVQYDASIRWGAKSGNDNDRASRIQYTNCDDMSISSIQHRAISITGQPGYIEKSRDASNRCLLRSVDVRDRPYYTVYVRLSGRGSTTDTNGNTIYDDNNREAGITYNCDSRSVVAVWNAKGSSRVMTTEDQVGIQSLRANAEENRKKELASRPTATQL